LRDPPQIVRLFESSFKRFLDKALREDFRWRRERRRCERRGMSCLRLEIFLAIDFFFSLITQHEKKSRNFSTGQKHSTPRQHDGPLGIRNEERRNEERHQTNLSKTPKNKYIKSKMDVEFAPNLY